MPQLSVEISELSQTQSLANAVAETLLANPSDRAQVIALSGTLGAGKTQWTRFFCEAFGVSVEQVTSPTYVLLQRYIGERGVIYHFDFYRLENSAQVWDLGIDELFEQPAVILIEWGDKFTECLPDDYLAVHLEIQSDGKRVAHLQSYGSAGYSMDQQLIARQLIARQSIDQLNVWMEPDNGR